MNCCSQSSKGGQLCLASTPPAGGNSQQRSWSYDQRGFLLSESQTIPAQVELGGGRLSDVVEVPIGSLRSPYKDSIDVSTQSQQDRFFNLVESIKNEGVQRPITVQPGDRGRSIRDVVLDFFGYSQ